MRSKLLPLFVLCLVCLFSARAQTVVENETSVVLYEKEAEIFLVADNSKSAFDTTVKLELLDEKSAVRASVTEKLNIEKGKRSYKITLPLGDLMKSAADKIYWFRLRYRVGESVGVISLSEILRDAFELRVVATDQMFPGMNYRSRIRALNPFTGKAVAGVKLTAELELELKGDDEQKLKFTTEGETDDEGFALLDLQVPIGAFLDDGEIRVIGRKNGFIREAQEDLQALDGDLQFLMLTDKPIYQPGQMLNVRGILLKGLEGKTVVSDSELEFTIEDEDDTVLFREKVKTSSFGIASVSWQIPENAALGNYMISVKNSEDDDIGFQRFRISRYDLPNFTVRAKALKAFYLPNEKQAEVEVAADYLFGKLVTKGRVRVVREDIREWNWKEQKYDIEEGESHEGETDAEGKFRAKFDLSKDHEDLKDDRWRKFRDLRFTAYYTDLTTNRTEQRRFDVRITREPIHVYFIDDGEAKNPAFPVRAYVSTFYADGTPVSCSVEVKGRESDGDDEKYRTLQKLKTNSFGVGRLNFMRPKFEDEDADLEIQIIARDKNGLKGTFGGEDYDDEIDFDEDDALQIETEKTIFKPGESIKLKISSTKKNAQVYIDIVKGWSVIDSYFVNLKDGKGELKIPYQTNFQGYLTLAGFYETTVKKNIYDYQFGHYVEREVDEVIKASRGVIFPAQTNLKLEAVFDKSVYKPGEEARVNFSVLDNFSGAVESALGIAVFDRAVEERARTDSEFRGVFSNYARFLNYEKSFAGISIKTLNDLDLSKPISDELQRVAEVLLYNSFYYPNIFHSRDVSGDAKSFYADYFKKQFEPLEKVLQEHYAAKNYEYPTDENSLRKILRENGIDFDRLRDPWEQNYRAVFETNKAQDILQIVSAGTDKKFGTKDDFTVSSLSFNYFTPIGKKIDKAIDDYHKRTGNYIRDEKTLLQELGVSELRDRFGRPYQILFETSGKYYLTRIRSIGKDGFDCKCTWSDDFEVWTNRMNYFAETELRIKGILQTAQKTLTNEDELKALLKSGGVDLDELRDVFGEKIYLVKREFSRYENVLKPETVSEYGKEESSKRTVLVPVTQGVVSFLIRSKGADKKENTYDDFTLAEFLQVIYEQSKDDPQPVIKNISFERVYAGSISGVVTDADGAAVPNATVTATNEETQASRSVFTNSDGVYFIANLASGKYSVKVEALGFQITVRSGVPVTASGNTKVDFTLEVGSISSVVEVSSDVVSIDSIDTLNASDSKLVNEVVSSNLVLTNRDKLNRMQIDFEPDEMSSAKSTPRLREYFPETLFWAPEIITDATGRAEVKFKMADNITTWKLYAIASTRDGKIGVAETEATAFQQFFVDLDPPKFLTAGDEIFLPVQVRNYTPTKQKVDVTMTRSEWFSFLSPEKQNVEVDKNSAANAVFGFKASDFVKEGKQRVTAVAEKDSDAIEKSVTVRPNGHEIVRTETRLFGGSAAFDVSFPSNALAKTPRAELKIYPNLMTHVTESVEGLLQRPYGCGEQTVSSTYPNLMILKFGRIGNALSAKAKKYLQKGYERLLSYQNEDGGFSYWGGKSQSDIALTAYALRFLTDAREFIETDEKVIEKARNYLVRQQRADGSFSVKYYFETAENERRTRLLTAYVARALALSKAEKNVLDKALAYLKTREAEIDEPYALALFGLASLESGNAETARAAVRQLEKSAKFENDAVYWDLESNTPFYGWGTTGRIETTALVLQLLTKIRDIETKSEDGNSQTDDLISRATVFLLRNKDRYGVWHSTQTTINVLEAFLASLSKSGDQVLEVYLNGRKIKEYAVSGDQIELIAFDLTDNLDAANSLEVKTSGGSQVMAQIVRTHYVDWQNAEISNRNVNDSRAIRFDYKCDKSEAKIMETVNCTVEAERIGFKGYGMLLAEIGLPPGADVSRESLEKAFEKDWSLSSYEILPDRIIVYMWAKAGGTKFDFSFKPRYGINAQTPASVLYDYYNEEAKATVAPMKFNVN
jgi:Large extracellular alpha-helical protein